MDYDFSILPPHILTEILLHTQKNENAVLVCQSWYYASFDPKITRTRRTIMTTGPTSIGVDQLARPITHLFLDHPNFNMLNLNELLIHSIDEWNSSELFAKIVGLNLPHLKKLDIQKISLNFSDMNFIQFCKVYQNLEYLHLSNVFAEHLYLIGRDMTNLKCLNLMCAENPQLSLLRNLKFLETLIIDRFEADHLDDETLFNALKWENLKKLKINKITGNVLNLICESLKNLVILKLMEVETKECEPIYRNLTRLEILQLGFEETTECHSNNIINSDEWNITRLVRLKEIYVSCYVSGITPNLLKTLPNLNEDCLKIISRNPYFEY